MRTFKKTTWFINLILFAGLFLTACNQFAAQPEDTPAVPTLAAEVLAGSVRVGHIASSQIASEGQSLQIKEKERLSTEDLDRAELGFEDGTRLELEPEAIISVQGWESDRLKLRQFNGSVVYQAQENELEVVVSVAASFGLERLEYSAESVMADSHFELAVDGSELTMAVLQGAVDVTINGTPYSLMVGDILSIDAQAQALVTQATPTPDLNQPPQSVETTPVAQAGATPTLAPGATDTSDTFAPPELVQPKANTELKDTDNIRLSWQSDISLDTDTWYEIQLWSKDDIPFKVAGRVQDTNWQPSKALEPGEYQWRIRLVRLSDGQYLSPPSETSGFEVIEFIPTATPVPRVNVPATPTTASLVADSYEQPAIIGPNPAQSFSFDESVVLQWQSVGPLADDQWYEVRFWREGSEWIGAIRVKEPQLQLPVNYNPGRYGWAVAVIKTQNDEYLRDISPQTAMRQFNWEARPTVGGDDGGNGEATPPTSR